MITTSLSPVFGVETGKIKVFKKGFRVQIFDLRNEPTDQAGFLARAAEHETLLDYCETNNVEYAEKTVTALEA